MSWMKPLRKLYEAYKILENKVQSHAITHSSEGEKREYILYWAKRTGNKIFVETGTYLGKTAIYMSPFFDRCYTIEFASDIYEKANRQLRDYENINLYHGDSADILPTVLKQINEPALFWMDAHYSGGMTAGAKRRTPIEAELSAILAHEVNDHLVLIDDAREFTGMRGYPTIKRLKKLVRKSGTGYKMIINNDIIVIYHEEI